jgi:hypothetical protein
MIIVSGYADAAADVSSTPLAAVAKRWRRPTTSPRATKGVMRIASHLFAVTIVPGKR